MAIARRNVSTGLIAATAPTLTLTVPAGVIDGDLMLVLVAAGVADGGTATVTGPAGWTSWAQLTSMSELQVRLYYRYASGEAAGVTTYSWAGAANSRLLGILAAYSGVAAAASGGPFDSGVEGNSGGSGTQATYVSVTTVTSGAMVVGLGAARNVTAGQTNNTWSPPAGWTEYADLTGASATANNLTAEAIERPMAAPGATGQGTATLVNSSAYTTFVVALRPAPASGPAKALTGAIAAGGVSSRAVSKRPAANVTPTGTKTGTLTGRRLAGSLAASGTKTGVLARAVAGVVTGSKTLVRTITHRPAGTVTITAVISRTPTRRNAGALAGAGAVVKTVAGKAPTGAIAPAAGRRKTAAKRPAGTVGAAGTLVGLARRIRALAGSLVAAGALARGPRKSPAGGIAPAGTRPARTMALRPAGVVSAAGALLQEVLRRLFGRAGTATLTVAPAAEATLSAYARHQAALTVTAVSEAATRVRE